MSFFEPFFFDFTDFCSFITSVVQRLLFPVNDVDDDLEEAFVTFDDVWLFLRFFIGELSVLSDFFRCKDVFDMLEVDEDANKVAS